MWPGTPLLFFQLLGVREGDHPVMGLVAQETQLQRARETLAVSLRQTAKVLHYHQVGTALIHVDDGDGDDADETLMLAVMTLILLLTMLADQSGSPGEVPRKTARGTEDRGQVTTVAWHNIGQLR